MIFRIPSGHHRARPLRFGIWWNRHEFSWKLTFTDSCRYDLGHPDQLDVNKLVGIGYLPGHHKHSARFGWVYDREIDRVVLHAYCYVNGQRIAKSICSCVIGTTYSIGLKKPSNMYFFQCHEDQWLELKTMGTVEVPYYHKKKLGYRLGIYFGGNRTPNHEVRIILNSVK